MMLDVRLEVREIVRRHGRKLIKLGFVGKDNSICDELRDIGSIIVCGGERLQQEWAGYEAVMGVMELDGKVYRDRKYFE